MDTEGTNISSKGRYDISYKGSLSSTRTKRVFDDCMRSMVSHRT